ncbi:MAG: ester cyclase [Alphaproteobacteria bacterium]|nr:ester cyclase [Alphaproteobacteria bacterium]
MPFDPAAIAKVAKGYTAAWNSGDPTAVASSFAENGQIVINRGEPSLGRAGMEQVAAGFYADVPDLELICDNLRCAGSHVVFQWTFTGHDATTGAALNVQGWEEWDLDENLKVLSSRGWFDAEDYERQVARG